MSPGRRPSQRRYVPYAGDRPAQRWVMPTPAQLAALRPHYLMRCMSELAEETDGQGRRKQQWSWSCSCRGVDARGTVADRGEVDRLFAAHLERIKQAAGQEPS